MRHSFNTLSVLLSGALLSGCVLSGGSGGNTTGVIPNGTTHDGDPCSHDTDCASGSCNSKKSCGGSACTSNAQCAPGWTCVDNSDPLGLTHNMGCQQNCGDGLACSRGSFCGDGTCLDGDMGPEVDLGVPTPVTVGNPLTVSASVLWGSGVISSYDWSFGDGATAKTVDPSTSHTWTEAGDLVMKLVVHDANGTDVTAQRPISVCYGFGAHCTEGVTKCCGACVTSAGNPSFCGYP